MKRSMPFGKDCKRAPKLPQLNPYADNNIVYAKNNTSAGIAVKELKNFNSNNIYGLDIEWKINYTKGAPQNKTALLQLCSDSIIVLFHLHHMTIFPPELKELLEDSSIIKTGANIRGDAIRLYKDYSIRVENYIDLCEISRQVDNDTRKYHSSYTLESLCERELHMSLNKDERIRKGDWECRVLSEPQIFYAASDVLAGYLLFKCLAKKYQSEMKGSSINEWLIQRDNDQLKQEVKVIIEGQKTTGEKENEKKDEDDDEKEEMLGEIDSMSMRKYRKLIPKIPAKSFA